MNYDQMPREELIAELKAWRSKFRDEVAKGVDDQVGKERVALYKQSSELADLVEKLQCDDAIADLALAEDCIEKNSFLGIRLRDFWTLRYHAKELKRELRKMGVDI